MSNFNDNVVWLIGANLTRDSELKFLTNGQPQLNFSVAYNHSFKRHGAENWEEETSFFNVTWWGSTAQKMADNLKKGAKVMVKGRLRSFKFTDRDGAERSGTEIVAEKVILYSVPRRGESSTNFDEHKPDDNGGSWAT